MSEKICSSGCISMEIAKPYVIDIKGNSLDDGPGVRTTIFFKGCPLSCIWCHNPESKKATNELAWDVATCIGDGGCLSVCPQGALSPENPGFVDRDKCILCFKCADICPAKAMTRVGRYWEIEDLVDKVKKDKPFYDISHGGVTLSGGEATLFTEWMGELAKAIHAEGINILIETSGYFDYDKVSKCILPYLHDIYCDIKIYDREKHKKYCGVYNDKILENFRRMFNDKDKYGYNILPRVPLVPDITDTDENLEGIASFLEEIGCMYVDLLPYNPTWYSKTAKIGVSVDDELSGLDHFQSRDKIDHCKEIFKSKNINC